MLCELFPDEFPLSDGISRFNMRLNNNVSFSVSGGNNHKFTQKSDVIPVEYKRIINEVKKHPERCEELISYSKIVTGHTILNADGTVNNIISYNNIVAPYKSFKSIYEKYGLMQYYVPLPPDLDGPISPEEITDSDIDMYRASVVTSLPAQSNEESPTPLTTSLPSEFPSPIEVKSSGGKRTKKMQKKKHKKTYKKKKTKKIQIK